MIRPQTQACGAIFTATSSITPRAGRSTIRGATPISVARARGGSPLMTNGAVRAAVSEAAHVTFVTTGTWEEVAVGNVAAVAAAPGLLFSEAAQAAAFAPAGHRCHATG